MRYLDLPDDREFGQMESHAIFVEPLGVRVLVASGLVIVDPGASENIMLVTLIEWPGTPRVEQ